MTAFIVRKVAVLGAGVMGAQIAAHLVNAQVEVLLYDLPAKDGDKSAKAKAVGELVAQRAKEAGIDSVVFDRGGNKYAGRVAAVAEGARDAGLAF